jgi:thymidylate kinase
MGEPAEIVTYVAIEGIDGSGKSSVARAIEDWRKRSSACVARVEYLARLDQMLGRFLQHTFHAESHPRRARVLNAFPAAKMLLYGWNATKNWRDATCHDENAPMDRLLAVGDRSIVSLMVNFEGAFGSRCMTELAVRCLNAVPLPSDIIYLDILSEVAHERLRSRGLPLEANETVAELARGFDRASIGSTEHCRSTPLSTA